MAHSVVRCRVKDVNGRRYFAIILIADESTDILCTRQFTLLQRHVSDQSVVHENIFGLHEMRRADSQYNNISYIRLQSTTQFGHMECAWIRLRWGRDYGWRSERRSDKKCRHRATGCLSV
jgi:hypothetical protein